MSTRITSLNSSGKSSEKSSGSASKNSFIGAAAMGLPFEDIPSENAPNANSPSNGNTVSAQPYSVTQKTAGVSSVSSSAEKKATKKAADTGAPWTFSQRHIGPSQDQLDNMLKAIGVASLDQLVDETIPKSIQDNRTLAIPDAVSEYDALQELTALAEQNDSFKSYIGMGYANTVTPPVIQRHILENPSWYTQYTPYQPEISQGRLEALFHFQSIVTELTGLPIANASLLDEATAAAEAMLFMARVSKKENKTRFLMDQYAYPQTIELVKARAKALGISVTLCDALDPFEPDAFGCYFQYVGRDGDVQPIELISKKAKEAGILVGVGADLLHLVALTAPGKFGVDVVVGSSQRFGIPLGYGGPHAAFFATQSEYARQVPGRIIGKTVDRHGQPAYRMALQTREQHIRREKATSNICTAQALLAIMAAMYGIYHGPDGLNGIMASIQAKAGALKNALDTSGYTIKNPTWLDTLTIETLPQQQKVILEKAQNAKLNFWVEKTGISVTVDETTSLEDLNVILSCFDDQASITELPPSCAIPVLYQNKEKRLQQALFSQYRSETALMRYIKSLEKKDLSLTHSMIPLGSCTMKLNAAAQMIPLSWPKWNAIHPFVPLAQVAGYQRVLQDLEHYLSEITGLAKTSLQPNSGAQGELAGLLVIKAFHAANGESHRNVVLIPASAHGTNPASAALAGLNVVLVRCNEQGNTDLEDLVQKAKKHTRELAALMVTYPSTHGVFQDSIQEMCQIVHDYGGQVYMDGANLNAQVGYTSPAKIGADVCHINLHKTFSIPHGGGGPGMGPICVAAHLADFLPAHPLLAVGSSRSIANVSAAPWGSALILIISYLYIRLLGRDGIKIATAYAILNANYIKARLESHFNVAFVGLKGRVAHELIIDVRPFKKSAGIEVIDIAKRLMDYGFHAPTMSWPVPGTLMIEPTESENQEELDRFCDAMIAIKQEINEIESGQYDTQDNVLKNAPHTLFTMTQDEWPYPYSRKKAAYPLDYVAHHKFWPSVSRVDDAYGDRNLVCSCAPVSEEDI